MVDKKPMLPLFRDNRKATRRLINYSAWVQVDSGRKPIECLIRDMSDTGACLELTPLIGPLPQTFRLWLDKNGNVQRTCEIVWRRAYYVGVRFASRL